MNLRVHFIEKYNKKTDEIIFLKILENPELLKSLIHILRSEDWRLSHRCSGPLTKIAQKRPELLNKYQPELLDLALHPLHNAHLRNTLRIFQYLQVQEDLAGTLYDNCSFHVQNIQKPTAIRAFSATVMKNIAFQFPELIDELLMILIEYKDFGTIGFKNRINRLILEINRQIS